MPLSTIPITNTCKRGCCWTPYGTCARQHTCPHHTRERSEQAAREARESAARDAANTASLKDRRRNR